ncbi:protein TEX261-like [Oppia nitens]|uniref:protein TEX261-like n=1 Tax=Oppia nitens TaxID=1686743 RepID=UPI0023DBDCDF|nr:protein TEX261-like [Oppia nitens]
MWFLVVLTWFALLVQLMFIILSVASGLYYLAELVEEYSVVSAKVIKYMILTTLSIYLCLFLFEEFPNSLIITGLLSHCMYLILLRSFPYFNFTSVPFISSIVLLLVNHYFAFSYFSTVYYPFTQVLAFFTLCLWFIPFALFISLSANENVLPTVAESRPLLSEESDVVSHYFSRRAKKYGLLSLFNYAKDSLLPQRVKKSF